MTPKVNEEPFKKPWGLNFQTNLEVHMIIFPNVSYLCGNKNEFQISLIPAET